ncbi:P-loop containing nucleoside triphosphate hydrolase protein [Bimuria novae-zelandiae CBS 107.79]|uniref:P-loop containing nucleoside triphosphate hydrolase protein n=1 Tax=Bimuria novae-zelandiae CBS 107.79 TaxID=1447943 RepID=A0A6A5UR93_9PLEO|nr:P-loop containing nucleoside triphosphate hydrolase protein [Bimuria novae-zelandiae CBS 107.79]
MEVAGLAVGIAGLGSLLSGCTNAFRLVQQGRSFGKDYKILETKFGNQELRLRAWGRACGLSDGTRHHPRLDDCELHQQLEATLECIKLLLGDAKHLQDTYGLKPCPKDPDQKLDATLKARPLSVGSSEAGPSRKASLTRLLSRRSLLQRDTPSPTLQNKSTPTLATVHWIIEDRAKFSELIKHLKDFIDDLEDLTMTTDIPRRQLVFVEYEVESIDDVETLEDMESAREGDDDVVSDAASARLERISEGSASVRTSMQSGRDSLPSIVTLESLESYFTARTHFSRPSSIAASEYFVPTAEFHRVTGYELYGDEARSNKLLRLQARPSGGRGLIRKGQAGKNGKAGPPLRCIAVGDISARKTDLLSCLTLGGFPTAHTPLVFKECITECSVDGHSVDLVLCDTSGLEEYEKLRTSSYSKAGVIIICLLVDPLSPNYDQVRQKWIPEVNNQFPEAGRIIVGIEPDRAYQTSRIDVARGKRLAAEVDASYYIQCNLETGAGVDDVLEAATRAAIIGRSLRNGAESSRGWRFSWRDYRQRLPAIEETGASFEQKRKAEPPSYNRPVPETLYSGDFGVDWARVPGTQGLFITNPDDEVCR